MISETDLYRFLASSAEDVEDVCHLIRANELQLVAVELYATPRIPGAAGELLLVFGGDADDQDAAA